MEIGKKKREPQIKQKETKVSKTGYMTKQGGSYKSWKHRLFVLEEVADEGVLNYFEVKGPKRIKKGEIQMKEVTDVTASVGAKIDFCMDIHTPKRIFKIAASSYEEMEAWMSALRSWV